MVAFIVLLGIIFGGVKLLAVANNISDSEAMDKYICNNIKWCSNKITFTENDITNYAHIDSKTFYIALNELYNEQVIINTTKKSTYVVNHNYIFRGSMTDFIKIYHDKYDGMVGFLDDKKRIILDD